MAGLKTWLASNNIDVQYRQNPVTTAVTDPTIITALENIRTYQGVTNITAGTPISGSYGLNLTTSLAAKENTSNKSTAAIGTSTTLFPTQSAVKTYVDTANALKVDKAGDTMTGVLNTVSVFPTSSLSSNIGSTSLRYASIWAQRMNVNANSYFDGTTGGYIDAVAPSGIRINGVGYIPGTGFPGDIVTGKQIGRAHV